MTSLRSLDLGQDTGIGLVSPHITMIHNRLTYLRVSLQDAADLYHVMSSATLSTTLEQLHVTMRAIEFLREKILPKGLKLPVMMNVQTFTLVQTIFSINRIEWSTIESFTASDHMPVLRRVNLTTLITVDDLSHVKESLLFTDDRRIDVQFAFIVDSDSFDIQLSHQVPHGSHSHPRQVVGVTCVVSGLSLQHHQSINNNCYVSMSM